MNELSKLGIGAVSAGLHDGCEAFDVDAGGEIVSANPTDGKELGRVRAAGTKGYDVLVERAQAAFKKWIDVPAPRRGLIVREIGDALREKKKELGRLVSMEMGKILSEGEGEVQEMIDICDFAVGLSRQLYGLTMQSERVRHRMMEQWHPLGLVGVVTAFNFPVAVWAWNAAIAAVCGDVVIWKPSSKTPLCAVAVQEIVSGVMRRHQMPGIFNMIVGRGASVGDRMLNDRRIPLVSATGSCLMGKKVAAAVSQRFGRTILELGGNNALIVLDDADLELATRAILFGAIGTSGQRCTSTRRVMLQKGIAKRVTDALCKSYKSVRIGDPTDPSTHMGPLVDEAAVTTMMEAMERIRSEGGEVLYGGNRINRPGCFVEPTIVKAHRKMGIVRDETFAPILYLFEVDSVEQAIEMNNEVDQGLSSALFTSNLAASERFVSPLGSDCGIANVNVGTSGAEIGGAFGGEKDTGGGREAGSDSWKQYMRRQTSTINWSGAMPLAQGVVFDI